MIKRFALLFTALLASLTLATSASAKTNANFGFEDFSVEAFVEASVSGELTIVNIWGENCPLCLGQRKALSALIKSNPDLYGNIRVLAIEATDPNRPAMVGSHKLSGWGARTMMILFRNGEQVAITGNHSQGDLSAFIGQGL